MNCHNPNNPSNDRFQVVSVVFRKDSSSTIEDIAGVGKARPNLEAVDFIPKAFHRGLKKVKQN
ncbi:MAG: Unknown protein [uncultured Aureispira sp.]|uniref:Uncharacterized protein n=1 Tax=uncultured Aureispira sp. TaxID=1331704 RepID=A0A6S6UG49_9BACT|nr:MAG: Unknown protein [uncultured Aureispira sp.]